MTFDPPAAEPSQLDLATLDSPEEAPPLRLQADPPSRLPNLARIPIALVSAEASPIAAADPVTQAFLQQGGCTVDLLRLADHGVHGNGHGMMFERNNREVLEVILRWLAGLEQA